MPPCEQAAHGSARRFGNDCAGQTAFSAQDSNVCAETFDVYTKTFDLCAKTSNVCAETFDVYAKTFDLCAETFDVLGKFEDVCAEMFDVFAHLSLIFREAAADAADFQKTSAEIKSAARRFALIHAPFFAATTRKALSTTNP